MSAGYTTPPDTFGPYTGLLHLAGIDPSQPLTWGPPSYRPQESVVRLHAYRILASYDQNVARFNRARMDLETRRKQREYGDAALLRQTVVAGVLGAGAVFTVRGAATPPPEVPNIAPQPTIVETGDEQIDAQVRDVALTQWRENAAAVVAQWEEAHAAYPDLLAHQAWIDEWVEAEQAQSKIFESESTGTVPLGDGVLALGWDNEKQRPSLHVYQPDDYEPVLSDAEVNAFPDRVHLVWDFERGDHSYVRRITYELLPLDQPRVFPGSTSPSDRVCFVTDREWRVDAGNAKGWDDLADEAGTSRLIVDGEIVDRIDLKVKFIPVIHIPNTPSAGNHFGTSLFTPVAQLLDEVSSLDTDITRAAEFAAAPSVWVSGVAPADKTLKAATIFGLGENGNMGTLDLSGSVVALQALMVDMLERLSVNGRVPSAVTGRVKSSDVSSGVELRLLFAPFEQLVSMLRLTRYVKYGLLIKFAMRIAQAHGDERLQGPTPRVDVTFASTTPTDLSATVANVVSLLNANGIPRRLALQTLHEAGFHDADIESMLTEIAAEDTAGAKEAAEATASEQVAADLLGVELDTDTTESPLDDPDGEVL